jgi:hypothetical protein
MIPIEAAAMAFACHMQSTNMRRAVRAALHLEAGNDPLLLSLLARFPQLLLLENIPVMPARPDAMSMFAITCILSQQCLRIPGGGPCMCVLSPEEYEIALVVEGDHPPPPVCWILQVS